MEPAARRSVTGALRRLVSWSYGLPMRITTLLTVMTLSLMSSSSYTQPEPAIGASCRGSALRALDFWVGRWDVKSAAGQPRATSQIDLVADGCAVLERYNGLPGPAGRQYIGSGLHVFDPTLNQWRQLFSDNRPAATLMTGRQVDGTVVYEWEAADAQGKRTPKRYTLSKTPDGSSFGVKQLGETSNDGGKTWTVEFDLRYLRAR